MLLSYYSLYTAAAAPVCCCCFHCWAEIALGVSPCRLSTPCAPAAGLLPTTAAAAVAIAWALLPSTSTGCCVRYSLLVYCCCAKLLLLRSSNFFRHFSPWNHPPYTTRFSDNFLFATRNSRLFRHSYIFIIKIKIHSSCDIEDFVETHLCKLCVILRSRALRVVCPH